MEILFPFVFIAFCVQFFTLGCVKDRFLRWGPVVLAEVLLLAGMIHHWMDPPSFDILGWEIYLWMMGCVFLGGALAWGAFALYERRKR